MSTSLPYITFLTSTNAATFWQYIRAVLYVVMPLFLIWAATQYAGLFVQVVRRAFGLSNSSRHKDDIKPVPERDYDIKIKH